MNDKEKLEEKLQGRVSTEDKNRIEFLISEGYVLNESDAVREGSRALWREYLAGSLKSVKERFPEETQESVESTA